MHNGTRDDEQEHEESQLEFDRQEYRRVEDLGVGLSRTPGPSTLPLGIGLGMGTRSDAIRRVYRQLRGWLLSSIFTCNFDIALAYYLTYTPLPRPLMHQSNIS